MSALPDGFDAEIVTHSSGNQTVLVRSRRRPGDLVVPPPVGARAGKVQFYVPYTSIDPRTVGGAPPGTIWCNVSTSPLAFYGALRSWWAKGEDFATIEHDVVCRPDVFVTFEICPEPWCAYGYADICCQDEHGHSPCMEAWRNTLGCTRFRAELMAAVPDALEGVPMANNGLPLPSGWEWTNLCDGLANHLRSAGYSQHWHFPMVEHHHRL